MGANRSGGGRGRLGDRGGSRGAGAGGALGTDRPRDGVLQREPAAAESARPSDPAGARGRDARTGERAARVLGGVGSGRAFTARPAAEAAAVVRSGERAGDRARAAGPAGNRRGAAADGLRAADALKTVAGLAVVRIGRERASVSLRGLGLVAASLEQ